MRFRKKQWQTAILNKMIERKTSYRELAQKVRKSKATVHRWMTNQLAQITVEDMLLVSRIFDVDPLPFFVVDEVQLKLL